MGWIYLWQDTASRTGQESILTLVFQDVDGKGEISLTQANVPGDQLNDIKRGWSDFYWKPWKKYIQSLKSKK